MSAMPEHRVMKIIERDEHITVKTANHPLMRRLRDMVKKNLIEYESSYRDVQYYRKKGSTWTFRRNDNEF